MTFSRRRVLAALAAAGGAGALTGSGTAAMFTDSEGFDSALTTGAVDLVVEYDVRSGPSAGDAGVIDGPRVTLPLDELGAEHASGSTVLTFALPQGEGYVNNPAALWLAATCPEPAATRLADALRLTLSYFDCETDAVGTAIETGTLREVADRLGGGRRIDGDGDPATAPPACLTDEVCVLVEYELVGYVGSESVDLPLYFKAEQCRHDETPTNPFEGLFTATCEGSETPVRAVVRSASWTSRRTPSPDSATRSPRPASTRCRRTRSTG
ncbi:hypothetical protein [Halosegnis marinus]|uniref:hypothetical protein n=1 Tax=Halosegnis marinus TaxID=3034023 RepID=UPI00360DDAF0